MNLEKCPVCEKINWQKRPEKKFLVCGSCNPLDGKISCEVAHSLPSKPSKPDAAPDPAAATLIETVTLTLCRPWCGHCGSYMARESTWSDGHAETRCWTCRRVVPEWPPVSAPTQTHRENQQVNSFLRSRKIKKLGFENENGK